MKKTFIITSMAAFATLCFSLTAQAQGPVVVSDKDDYSPGETALFQASGFQPNELLDFSVAVSDGNGGWVPDIAWADVAADASGGAEVDYVVPESWANQTLQLTVMGLSSGLIAQTTFTDAALVHNVDFTASGLPSGTMITVTGTFINTQGHTGTIDGAFTTPGSSNDNGCQVNTTNGVIFASYPPTVAGVGGHYSLTSFSLDPSGTANGTLHDTNISTGSGEYDTDGQNNGSGGVHTTIIGNYTFVPDVTPTPTPSPTPSPVNHPPVITCSSAASPSPTPVDLGQAVGCLGTGTGFGHDFPVTYSQDGPGNPVTVTAHFTLADNTTVIDVPVATVRDPDVGDTVTVTLTNGTNPVTISGPGSSSNTYTVHIEAVDNHGLPATPEDCGGVADATITYNFSGFFPPLSGQINTKVKQGSGVPVKFQIRDCNGTLITPDNLPGPTPSIDVTLLVPVVPNGDPTVDDAGASNGDTFYFRWDTTGMQWIFNLKTNSTYLVGSSYLIWANLDNNPTVADGVNQNVAIAIKR